MAISTTRKATFVVSLNVAGTTDASVDYAAVAKPGDTAVAGTDFEPVTGTLNFAAGELSKNLDVALGEDTTGALTFHLVLSNPTNCTLGLGGGLCTIGAAPDSYLSRFDYMYAALKDTANGYFGPPTGPKAFSIPYHCPEKLIAEAPDYGHESVSETASFWVGLETWQGVLHNDWAGYADCWNSIVTNYVPSAANQPIGPAGYDPEAPATYQPEKDLPSQYPVTSQVGAPVGPDPLYDELVATYGNRNVFLMHWLIDVDGAFGFKNGDGATVGTFVNNFQRGLQESTFETVTFPCWEDYAYGAGTSGFGYLPLYGTGTELYPSAPFAFSKQYRYTCAPDAEGRALQWAFRAKDMVTGTVPTQVTQGDTYAKKMGDYLRYALFDKYFRKIGDNQHAPTSTSPYDSCHFLTSWYASWGGEIPASGAEGSWSFRIGSSEAHIGYQTPNIAYQMATGGGGHVPLSPSAGDIWLGALYKQLEMMRWLQTSKGPLAGGVSNSICGRYLTPTNGVTSYDSDYVCPADGRELHRFYGMTYTYAPVWHDPPSNNWFGFNVWGMHRVADLLHIVSTKTGTLNTETYANCECMLDRWMSWILDTVVINTDGTFSLPDTLSWVSDTVVSGKTTTVQNLEGKYEYIPNTTWPPSGPGTTPTSGDYATFWNPNSVPNSSLDFTIVSWGQDLGVGSCLASTMLFYAQAKRNKGKFTTAIPQSSSGKTAHDVYVMAKAILDSIWNQFKVPKGVAVSEYRRDYTRYEDPIYIPSSPAYVGHMPNGDVINSSSTFISIRTFMKSDPDWAQIEAYAANPLTAPVPQFTYHRFWAQVEFATANATMHQFFSDLAAP